MTQISFAIKKVWLKREERFHPLLGRRSGLILSISGHQNGISESLLRPHLSLAISAPGPGPWHMDRKIFHAVEAAAARWKEAINAQG